MNTVDLEIEMAELDLDWLQLIMEAKNLGLQKEDVLEFLNIRIPDMLTGRWKIYTYCLEEEMQVKKVFIYLAVLNLVDAVVTFWGLQHSLIEESNRLMKVLYQSNPLYFLFVKAILSSFLLAFLVLNKLPTRSSIKKLALTASILYTMVCIYHGVWITNVFSN